MKTGTVWDWRDSNTYSNTGLEQIPAVLQLSRNSRMEDPCSKARNPKFSISVLDAKVSLNYLRLTCFQNGSLKVGKNVHTPTHVLER